MTSLSSLSPDVLSRYRRRFDALDLNHDGVISLREMAAVSKVFGYKLSLEELGDIFGKSDLNADGGITFEEFAIAMAERAKRNQQIAPIRRIFTTWDTKNRGYITSDEAHPYLHKNLGFDLNKTESLIDMFDKNRDYRLSLLEFQSFYSKYEELLSIVDGAFRQFDSDGDGYVTYEEALAAMTSRGRQEAEVQAVFQKYDTDFDGRLDRQEFAAFWDVPIF